MLLKVSGQHITLLRLRATSAVTCGCTDTRMRSCALMNVHKFMRLHRPPSHTHILYTQSWLWDEGGWLMKACVHYYNIVSVEASSVDRHLDQMKCDWVVYFFMSRPVMLPIHRQLREVSTGIYACFTYSTRSVSTLCETESQSTWVNCREVSRVAVLQHARNQQKEGL